MNDREQMLDDLGRPLNDRLVRLGYSTLGQLAFGAGKDRQLLAVLSIRGTPEEAAAARRVLNAIALAGQPALEDELAARRARRQAAEPVADDGGAG